jgi:PLP dependent protein
MVLALTSVGPLLVLKGYFDYRTDTRKALRGQPKAMVQAGGDAVERLAIIRERIARAAKRFDAKGRTVTLVAVSKTFGVEAITPLIDAGQRIFGENRVQEAQGKWPALRAAHNDVELHLIGPLQTNKVRAAVALFDVIETVDRDKLARALGEEMRASGRQLACYVQVNIGGEAQKAGVAPQDASDFVARCREVHGLDVVGMMCIPPVDEAPGPYFAQLALLARSAGVGSLSMGMSGDFETAIAMGATHVRIGSALFGTRPPAG